ncbi:MAG: hypothetical protein J0L93_03445 [Deltaproteobacteria bacterium]|nr:hypothetical protein [Deltaproteobacteria bacterium]
MIFQNLAILLILATQPGEVKDLLKAPLSYDLKAADTLLDGRSWASTSPHFSNPDNFTIGLGKAKEGVMWGDVSVGFATSATLTLNATGNNGKMKKGEVVFSVVNLRFDKESGTYKGIGSFMGRSHANCPIRTRTSKVTVRMWPRQAFQGAWHTIEGYPDDWEENKDCVRVSVPKPVSSGFVRTFTTVETIRAIEQASSIFKEAEPAVLAAYAELQSKREAQIQEAVGKIKDIVEASKAREKYKKEYLDPIALAKAEIAEVKSAMSQTEWALKFGGHVKYKTFCNERFEKTASLKEPNSKLFEITAMAMDTAIGLRNLKAQLAAQKAKAKGT